MLELLQERIHEKYKRNIYTFSVSFGAIALGFYLVAAIYLSVIRTIQALESASIQMAEGVLDTRVTLDTKDELKMVGAMFNKMTQSVQVMIYERDRAEEELLDQKQFVEDIIDYSATPTFVIDVDHHVIFWNKACEEFTGITADEALGTHKHRNAFYAEPRLCLVDRIIDGKSEEDVYFYRVLKASPLNSNGLYAEVYLDLEKQNHYVAINAL